MRSSKKENADYQSTNQLETGENKPVFGSWNSPLETEKLTKPKIEKIGHFIFDLGDLGFTMVSQIKNKRFTFAEFLCLQTISNYKKSQNIKSLSQNIKNLFQNIKSLFQNIKSVATIR